MGVRVQKWYSTCKKHKKIVDVSFVLFFVALLYGFTIARFPIIYDTNDDWMIQDILSGSITGNFEPHAIFIKLPLAMILSFCYLVIPKIPWFGVYLMGLWIWCTFLILHKIVRKTDFFRGKAAVIFAVPFIFIHFMIGQITTLQHMSTAGISFATAIFLFLTLESGKVRNLKQGFHKYGVIFVLVLLAFMTRYESVILLAPIGGIVVIVKLFLERKNLREYVLFLIVVCGFLGLIWLVDYSAYQSEDWKEFKEYNVDRSQIYDYYYLPDFEENKEFYQELEISYATYQGMLEGYQLLLYPEVTSETMHKIFEKSKLLHDLETSILQRGKNAIKNYYWFARYSRDELIREVSLFALYLIIFILAILIKKWNYVFFEFLLFSGARLSWIVLFYIGRVVARATFSLYFVEILMLIAFGILLGGSQSVHKKMKEILYVLSLVCVCIATIITSGELLLAYTEKGMLLENRAEELHDVESYCESHGELFYYIDIISVQHDSKRAFESKSPEIQNYVYTGSWLCNSPILYHKLLTFDIKHARDALFTKNDVLLIFEDDLEKDYFWKSMSEFATYDVTLWDVFSTSNGKKFAVYKLSEN